MTKLQFSRERDHCENSKRSSITSFESIETIFICFIIFIKKILVSIKLNYKIQNYRLASWPLINCILLITRKSFRFRLRNSVYAEYTIVNTSTFEVPSALLVFSILFAIPSFGYFCLHLSGTQIKTLEWLTGEETR